MQHLSSVPAFPSEFQLAWTSGNPKAATGTQQPSGSSTRSRGTMLGRARLQAPAQCRPVPLLLPGLLGWLRGTEQSQSKPAVPKAAGTSHRAPHPPILHPRAPPPAAAAGLRNSSRSPIKDTFVLKGARAGFHKHEQHKSRLSPARLTLFSLPPHLLLAKGLNGSSICCGRLKPRREQRGRSLRRLASPFEKAAPKENICALASTRAHFLPMKSLIKVVFYLFCFYSC